MIIIWFVSFSHGKFSLIDFWKWAHHFFSFLCALSCNEYTEHAIVLYRETANTARLTYTRPTYEIAKHMFNFYQIKVRDVDDVSCLSHDFFLLFSDKKGRFVASNRKFIDSWFTWKLWISVWKLETKIRTCLNKTQWTFYSVESMWHIEVLNCNNSCYCGCCVLLDVQNYANDSWYSMINKYDRITKNSR